MIKHFLNFLGGLQTDVSPFLVAENDLSLMSNVVVSHKLGSILKRLGYQQVGDTLEAGKSVTGLHNFRQSSSVQKILATINNSAGTNLTLKYNDAGTWTDISLSNAWDGYEDAVVEMEDFISYCFFVGYDSTDGVWLPPRSLTNTAFGTTNCTSMPNAKFIKRYRNRLYIGNCDISGTAYPYRVYYSSVPSAGAISWTVATDFIEVDWSEEITGLGENWDRLLVFTEYSAYMYDQNQKKKVWDIGCINHRTIKNLGAHMIWMDRDGVWDSTGGRPLNIAGRIIDFIKASIAAGNTPFAEVIDKEYWLFVGDVTVNGISYTKPAVIYNEPTQSWRALEFASDTPTIFARYNSSGDDRLYMGLADGEVMEMTKYTDTTPVYTDDGNKIDCIFETKQFDFDMPEVEKTIQKLVFYTDRAQGLNLKAMIINKNTRALNKIVDIKSLKDYITTATPKGLKGNFIKIIGTESGKNPYWSLFGFTIKYEPSTKL